MKRIPISGPSITQKEIDYVTDAVKNAWYQDHNIYQERFEAKFADYMGRKHAIALPSCTSAIHLSLAALGVGPGDEVIVPEITWIASAAPIIYVRATPVFADIDPKTWCLSIESLEKCISPRTKAIITVDLYGNLPEMDKILAVAKRHGAALIEDAAQAMGSEYRGEKAGRFGVAGAFSFHGSKTMTTGEGGMLVTDDMDIYRHCRGLADHGRSSGNKMFWNSEVGYKYKMSNLQAALGLAQLERIEDLVDKKREIFSWYRQSLAGVQELTLNCEAPGIKNSYWMVTAVMDSQLGLKKEQVMKHLAERGISSRPFFYPLSSLPAFSQAKHAKRASERNRTAYAISPYAINLPSGHDLTEEKVSHICKHFKQILTGNRQPAS